MGWFTKNQAPVVEELQRTEALTKKRLRTLMDERGWHYKEDNDGDFGGRWDNDLMYFMLRGNDGEILNIMGYMREDIPMVRLDEARFALDEWHREHLWPTAFWRENDDAGLTFSVGAGLAIDWENGVTDDQIRQQFDCALSTIAQCFEDVRGRLALEPPPEEED